MKNSFKVSRIKGNNIEQFTELIDLLNEVFEEPSKVASERQLKKLLSKPEFHVIAAIKEGKIIGGLTAYELERYYTDKSELYIYDIAVKKELHNQGIGKKLIAYLKDYSTRNGIESIFVQAHPEDEQAVKFYKSILGKGEKVDHFNFEIKTA
ncbi:GNAT family N-acetyltransferase [Croceitalea rosinachiae]|uniref:GNAT family N-acetyltransferase n=1 Tax=Croceitalea rosinachiae TaxID=3075596 RepID=A0ABU3AF45_9FLAO|nr:GNAT family N-acetyltransferase [Croceitalea sp. F388]MDT0608162.1 GNAT family N-acetyltransferase [Croceitalea sp. F388]